MQVVGSTPSGCRRVFCLVVHRMAFTSWASAGETRTSRWPAGRYSQSSSAEPASLLALVETVVQTLESGVGEELFAVGCEVVADGRLYIVALVCVGDLEVELVCDFEEVGLALALECAFEGCHGALDSV